MSHPFAKMFESALKKSTSEDNLVLKEAEKLKEKGYSIEEITHVLKKLYHSLIQDDEARIVGDALEEFSRYDDDAQHSMF